MSPLMPLGCSFDESGICKVNALLCTKTNNLPKQLKAKTLQQPNRRSIGSLSFSYHATKAHCAERVAQCLANGLGGVASTPMLRKEDVGDLDVFEIVVAIKHDYAEKGMGALLWANAPDLP